LICFKLSHFINFKLFSKGCFLIFPEECINEQNG
jgi:hypothetical protein